MEMIRVGRTLTLLWSRGVLRGRSGDRLLAAVAVCWIGGCASGPPPPPAYSWGNCDYRLIAQQLEPRAQRELAKPIGKRAKDAGVHLLDYASACLGCGRTQQAQRALYEAILLTNDLALDHGRGNASLIFSESLKTWQGEAYERATIELLHGISLMQIGDFSNGRVAFDRAIYTDRFSKGAVVGYEGELQGKKNTFQPNETFSSHGGSVYQRDFLLAYLLRTLCYIQEGRLTRAHASHRQFKEVYAELMAATVAAPASLDATTWTGPDGRYAYPTVFLPPFAPLEANRVFDMPLEDLMRANLVVVAGTGCRPRKVKAGKMGYREAHYIHDAYLPPHEPVHRVGLEIDGRYAGSMARALDLFGQAAGRGPSAKDRAQERKEAVENVGEFLQAHGSYGLQYIGLLIRAVNQEKADIRQWGLLPNAVHVWIGRVESGPHQLTCVMTGSNLPVLEVGWAEFFGTLIRALEHAYLVRHGSQRYSPGGAPVAARHTRVLPIETYGDRLATVFVAEKYNAHVDSIVPGEPRRYVLRPRQVPEPRR